MRIPETTHFIVRLRGGLPTLPPIHTFLFFIKGGQPGIKLGKDPTGIRIPDPHVECNKRGVPEVEVGSRLWIGFGALRFSGGFNK